MHKKRITVGVFLLLLIAVNGCLGTAQSGISGHVLTRRSIGESYILSGDHYDPAFTPIAGARIFLALDKMGQEIVRGCDTSSDESGRYHLDTNNLPQATDLDGFYYLFVQKESYQEFTCKFTVGPLAPFRENRVVLKSLSKPKEDQ
jgi:hypothetical protein